MTPILLSPCSPDVIIGLVLWSSPELQERTSGEAQDMLQWRISVAPVGNRFALLKAPNATTWCSYNFDEFDKCILPICAKNTYLSTCPWGRMVRSSFFGTPCLRVCLQHLKNTSLKLILHEKKAGKSRYAMTSQFTSVPFNYGNYHIIDKDS